MVRIAVAPAIACAAAGAARDTPPPFELVFEWTVNGNQDLYVVGADGGTPRRLTTDPHVDALPRWSADGETVFFTSDRSGNWQVYSVPAAGGDAWRVTYGGGPARGPDYRPRRGQV